MDKGKLLLTLTNPLDHQDIITQLDLFLKLCRRKQTIFYKLTDLFHNTTIPKLDIQLHVSYLSKDFGLILIEQAQLLKEISNISYNKSLLYTLFIRMLEIMEQTKGRLKRKQVIEMIDEQKRCLSEQYSNQVQSSSNHIIPIIQIQCHGSNARIRKIINDFNKPKVKQGVSRSVKQKKKQNMFLATQQPEGFRKFSLTSKTMQFTLKGKKLKQDIMKAKSKSNCIKVFNKLYKPIQIKHTNIEAKNDIIKSRLEWLLDKNRQIQKNIGQYHCTFKDRKKEKDDEDKDKSRSRVDFRIKMKNSCLFLGQ